MKTFSGSKFRPTGRLEYAEGQKYNVYNQPNDVKEVFVPTKAYMNYLREKEEEQKALEFIKLKEKLQYEYDKYGEVDDVDYNLFLAMCRERGVRV